MTRRMRFTLILMFSVLQFSWTRGHAATIYVRPDGLGDYPTIQAALNASHDGDEIQLSGGVFTGDGNRDLQFAGKHLVVRSESNDPSSCVLDCEGSSQQWHRAFLFQHADGPDLLIEGLTIRNGYADAGGGAYCVFGAAPRISKCIFDRNIGTSYGGAIYAEGASIVLEDCLFSECTARDGGAIYLTGLDTNVSMSVCRFERNRADRAGGALCFYDQSSGQVSSCAFRSNAAETGGAVVCSDRSSPGFDGCVLQSNQARNGGAFQFDESHSVLSGCLLADNTAQNNGGALWIAGIYEAPTIATCTIADNSAAVGAGAWLHTGWARSTFQNTIIAFSEQGEALYADLITDPNMSCCDIFGNSGGDWNEATYWHLGRDGNFSSDPLFCRDQAPAEPYGLEPDSPCAPGTSCGQIGAFPVACDIVRTQSTTWGALKRSFR